MKKLRLRAILSTTGLLHYDEYHGSNIRLIGFDKKCSCGVCRTLQPRNSLCYVDIVIAVGKGNIERIGIRVAAVQVGLMLFAIDPHIDRLCPAIMYTADSDGTGLHLAVDKRILKNGCARLNMLRRIAVQTIRKPGAV